MAYKKISTTIRINEPIFEKLKVIANTEVRSVNNLIEYALTKFVEELEKGDSDQSEPPQVRP